MSSVPFVYVNVITLIFVLWMYERNMRSIRNAAAGKHAIRAVVDVACGVVRTAGREGVDDEVLHSMLQTVPIVGNMQIMLLKPNGDIIFGADWGSPGETVNVMHLRNRAGAAHESAYEQLIAKAMAGGGYVTYRARDEQNVRRSVTAYGRVVSERELIVCARCMHSG